MSHLRKFQIIAPTVPNGGFYNMPNLTPYSRMPGNPKLIDIDDFDLVSAVIVTLMSIQIKILLSLAHTYHNEVVLEYP